MCHQGALPPPGEPLRTTTVESERVTTPRPPQRGGPRGAIAIANPRDPDRRPPSRRASPLARGGSPAIRAGSHATLVSVPGIRRIGGGVHGHLLSTAAATEGRGQLARGAPGLASQRRRRGGDEPNGTRPAYRTRLRSFPPSWGHRPGGTHRPLPRRPGPWSPAPAGRPGITGDLTHGGPEQPEAAHGGKKGRTERSRAFSGCRTTKQTLREQALVLDAGQDTSSGSAPCEPDLTSHVHEPGSVISALATPLAGPDAPRSRRSSRCVRAASRSPHERTTGRTAGSHLRGRPLRHRTAAST